MLRIDLVSIFPEYFGVLDVSLMGRAQQTGLLDVRAHDLRTWTHDRHRTVDDTPYGGGAGMLMRPEPWGEALDELLSDDDDPVVIFTDAAGEPFRQATARELSQERRLIFCCGRYEGIDARVPEHTASRARVRSFSIGDYVLNGGEVAALVMVEAIARLVPGVMGNPESAVEESHEDGLLEYPGYTKPAEWRGLEVPEILRSGDHGRIAKWRHEQRVERTRRLRPDLLGEAPAADLN